MRALLLFLCLCLCLITAAAAAEPAPRYRVDYLIGFTPEQKTAQVKITVTPGTGRVQRLRLKFDAKRHADFEADGRLSIEKNRLTWWPPKQGPGSLRYNYAVNRRRGSGSYDARITADWALLRADRLIPPAAVIGPGGARSDATLRFELPEGWTNAEIGYFFHEKEDRFTVENPGRRFQQPLGWMIAGQVGTRREKIDDMEVVVAAPKGEDMHRNDILAFFNASSVEARHAFGRLPPKLVVVGAGDPMWRGGLSAPNSMYLHADRPLIGENGTSPLLHELTHVVTRIRGARGQDWIAESFAEYYSVQLLLRSGLVTDSRARKAYALMQSQGKSVTSLTSENSKGPRTARGVTLLRALDKEIREASGNSENLDSLTRQLVGKGRISLEQLQDAADRLIGAPSQVLRSRILAPQ